MPTNYLARTDLLFIDRKNKKALDISQIVMLRGNVNYTHIHLQNGSCRITAHTLKYYEEQLTKCGFIRIHKGYIVNTKCIVEQRNTTLQLSNGHEVNISRRKMKEQKFLANLMPISDS